MVEVDLQDLKWVTGFARSVVGVPDEVLAAAKRLDQGAAQTVVADLAQRAEEIHAEHHPGTFVPSLDSCAEHTRAEYEQLVRYLDTALLSNRQED